MTLASDILSSSWRSERAAVSDVLCAHCSRVVPPGLIDDDAEFQFCCTGCQAVFQTLHSCGLDGYYRLRDAADASIKPAHPRAGGFESFDSATFTRLYVQQRADGLATVDLALEGVTCAACVWLVEKLPRVLEGVVEARLSLREATVRVTWDPQIVALSRVAGALDRFGYTPHPARSESSRGIHQRETRRRLVHLGVAGAIMGNAMLVALGLYAGQFGHMEPAFRTFFRWLCAALGLVSLSWPGATFFKSALTAIRARTTNLDVPIALALVVGGIAGLVNVVMNRGEIYFDSLTVLIFLLLVGRFIQYRQQRRADDAVGLLFNLTPSTCHKVFDGSVEDVPAEALQIGDLVEIRPGELLPADGVVESGISSVNQALLTGESIPALMQAGGLVHAGSQNIDSLLRVRVSKVGQETRVGQLMRLIERGIQDKPAVVQFADRVAGYFVVVLSIVAAGVFAYWSRVSLPLAIDHTVALLIVTCPCVLGLATPLTLAIAIGRMARQDILIKSGTVLERLSNGGSMLLDKTGTITEGRLDLVKWAGDDRWRRVVAAVEARSNHPVARALFMALRQDDGGSGGLPIVSDVIERGDGGVVARCDGRSIHVGSPRFIALHRMEIPAAFTIAIHEMHRAGATAVLVAVDGVVVAAAGLSDRIRDDSAKSLAQLRRMGWRLSILSGDAPRLVAEVAARVGVDPDSARGGMSPEQKLSFVSRRTPGEASVMVGDGVNDAAALAAADVGIAVQGGAEASLSAADVYIASPGLAPLVDLVRMSRRAMRTIRRNLVVSLAYNLFAGTLAAAGVMSPLLAAIIMPVSSTTVLTLAVLSIGGFGRGRRIVQSGRQTGGVPCK